LLGFLAHDPGNLQLLGDAASTALDEGDPAAATSLLDRYSAKAALTPALVNLAGLAALGERRFVDAAGHFASLIEQGGSTPELRLNLAWSKAMADELAPALELLDEEVLSLGPRAATLKVRLLHRLDGLDEALETGASLAERYPDDEALMGALANVALDAERADLAGLYAGRAGSHPDGLTTVAMLMLDEDKVEESMTLFDRILEADAGNPRALLGKGLGALALGDAEAAAAPIDAAAAAFGDHLALPDRAGARRQLRGDPWRARRPRFGRRRSGQRSAPQGNCPAPRPQLLRGGPGRDALAGAGGENQCSREGAPGRTRISDRSGRTHHRPHPRGAPFQD
jgi:tetratricopeptide (TPR) repeat protein